MKKKLLSLLLLVIPFITFAQEKGIDQQIDESFKPFSDTISGIVFFPVFGVPFVLILLVLSALFFTLYFGFPNFRYFPTAINVVRGKYDHVDEGHGVDTMYGDSTPGEIFLKR